MAANPVGCSAAIAALDVLIDEKLSSRANEMGSILVSALEAAKLRHVKEITGRGLFYALVLDDKPPKVTPRRLVSLLAQRGVLASAAGPKRIRICPPLTISKEELLEGIEIWTGVFRDIEEMGNLPAEVIVDKRH